MEVEGHQGASLLLETEKFRDRSQACFLGDGEVHEDILGPWRKSLLQAVSPSW